MSSQRLILVADDNQDVRTITRTILESRGFRVVEAVNGTEAVAVARRDRPDLILMDLAMPEVDGWQALSLLKADPGLEETPVVAITSVDPPLEAIERAGFCALLNKPVTPPDIVKAIGVCLEAYGGGETWIHDLSQRIAAAP